jgi:hypothetical protein
MEKQDMEQIIGMLAKINARMEAWLTDRKDTRKETMACQEKMETRLEIVEPTSVDMESEAAQRQVPREDTAIMPVGEPRKRRRDRNLAAECRQKKQERAQSKDGCRKNLVAAHTTSRAVVARRRRTLFIKETTWDYRGCRKRLAVARRGTTPVRKWHGARKISSGKVGPETTLQEEPLENGRPGRDVWWIRRAIQE